MASKPLDPTQRNVGGFRPVAPVIEDYVATLLSRYDEPVLLAMEELARQKSFPIVGRLVGPFLEMLAATIGAKRIYEFGSGFGYSAYWFARAVGKDGTVICTDGSKENVELARGFLTTANLISQVDLNTGWAQDIFKNTDGEFDIIYNDVDKGDYPEVWKLAANRVRPGGLYICDNVLWSGRVTQSEVIDDPVPGWTEAIKEHNQLIANDKRFDFFVNPTRDGVIVARRRTRAVYERL